MKKILNNKAITLIALVITIVILIIIASTVIYLTVGENGIIGRTTQSKKSYDESSIKERFLTVLIDYKIENQTTGIDFETFINDSNKNGGAVLIDSNENFYTVEFEETYFTVSKNGDITGKLDNIDIKGVNSIQTSINDLISNTEIELTSIVQYEEGKENDENTIVRTYKFSIYNGETLVKEITTAESTIIVNELNIGTEYKLLTTGYNNNGNTIKSETTFTKLPVYAWNKYPANSVVTYNMTSQGYRPNSEIRIYENKNNSKPATVVYKFNDYQDMESRFMSNTGTWSTNGMQTIPPSTTWGELDGKYVLVDGSCYLLQTYGSLANDSSGYHIVYEYTTKYWGVYNGKTYSKTSDNPVGEPLKSNNQNEHPDNGGKTIDGVDYWLTKII